MMLSCSSLGQDTSLELRHPESTPQDSDLGTDALAQKILRDLDFQQELTESTLPIDIDRLILNDLARELLRNRRDTERLFGMSKSEADELEIILSNSVNYTNIDESRAHREMCLNWRQSRSSENNGSETENKKERIANALTAYEYRIYRDKIYIAENDRVLLMEIERFLSSTAWRSFNDYMQDRRGRLNHFPGIKDHSSSASKGFDERYLQLTCN